MTLLLTAAAAFACGAVYDIINIRFMAADRADRAARAANYSTALGAAGAFGVLEYIHQPVALVFLLCGYWVGTYIGVRSRGRRP